MLNLIEFIPVIPQLPTRVQTFGTIILEAGTVAVCSLPIQQVYTCTSLAAQPLAVKMEGLVTCVY